MEVNLAVKAIAIPQSGAEAGKELVLVHVSMTSQSTTSNLALVSLERATRYSKKYYQLSFPTSAKAIEALEDFIHTLKVRRPNLRSFTLTTLPV